MDKFKIVETYCDVCGDKRKTVEIRHGAGNYYDVHMCEGCSRLMVATLVADYPVDVDHGGGMK